MPWAVSLSLGDDKLFFRTQVQHLHLLHGLFDLILLFVCQICHVYCETEIENKQNLFKKFFSQLSLFSKSLLNGLIVMFTHS